MLRTSILALILLAAPALAVNPTLVRDTEDMERPGVLQFPKVTQRDEVRVDGELVPAKGLARTNYNLMIAPGEYLVTIKFANLDKKCESRVKVAPGEVVRPDCALPSVGQYARLLH